MFRSNWFWFLRPTLGVVLCYSIAIFAAYLVSQTHVDALDEELSTVSDFASDVEDLQGPSPEWTAKEVVRIQASALSDPDRKRGVIRCMRFASPDNLIVTGPLERFAKMVRGPRFSALTSPDAVLVGDPIFDGKNARVLVTAMFDQKVNAFVWILVKQTGGAYKGCWMTDAVFSTQPPPSSNEI